MKFISSTATFSTKWTYHWQTDHLFTSSVTKIRREKFSHCSLGEIGCSHNRHLWVSVLVRFCQTFAEPPLAVISKAKAATPRRFSRPTVFHRKIFFEGKYSSLSNACILANNGRERGTYSYAYDGRCRPFSILLPRKKPAILGRRTKTGTPRSRQKWRERARALKVRAGSR